MNPISKALDEVKYKIPKYILQQAFVKPSSSWREAPVSMDEEISSMVIKPRVLIDCKLMGGTEAFIFIGNMDVHLVNPYTAVYRIPKDRTQGRTILSVKSVYNFLGGLITTPGTIQPYITNDLVMAGNSMMNALSAAPAISTAYVQLIGENTVMVKENTRLSTINYLRCTLEDDENMNHLQIHSYPAFAKLVELAVKSYIYNTLIIQIDTAFLQGGQELGKFKEIVESYADAEEMYQDYLRDIWQGVAFMNDNENFLRFIKLNIGGMK